jgi:uncharacterized peroxidase-related enzyme
MRRWEFRATRTGFPNPMSTEHDVAADAPLRATLPLVTDADAGADTAAHFAKARESMGFVPNTYAAMGNSPGLLTTYRDGIEWFRAKSGFTPAEREVVLLTISRFNECTYCMAAHSFTARLAKTPAAVIEAIRTDTAIPDPRLAALATFTRTMLETAGRPSTDSLDAFRAAGYTDHQVLEIVLAVAVKTISNWTNHLLDPPVDDVFSSCRWTAPTVPTPVGATGGSR